MMNSLHMTMHSRPGQVQFNTIITELLHLPWPDVHVLDSLGTCTILVLKGLLLFVIAPQLLVYIPDCDSRIIPYAVRCIFSVVFFFFYISLLPSIGETSTKLLGTFLYENKLWYVQFITAHTTLCYKNWHVGLGLCIAISLFCISRKKKSTENWWWVAS